MGWTVPRSTPDMRPPAREHCTRLVAPLAAVAAATAGTALDAGAARPKAPAHPQIRAFKPIADAYVTAAAPRRNFGRAPTLRVDGAPQTTTYLRFRLRSVRGEPEAVTLLLHANGARRTPFEVRRVPDEAWREQRLTYANAPRPSLRSASARPVRRGAWSAVDVTALADRDEFTLAITTRSRNAASFGSRESRFGPRLAVQLPAERESEQVLDGIRSK